LQSHSRSNHEIRHHRVWWLLPLAAIFVVTISTPSFARRPEFGLRVTYNALYESNIYHSFADTNQSQALVNALTAKGSWRKKQSRHLLHRVNLDVDYDQYVRNENRNQGSAGISYEPRITYARHGRILLLADIARRQKDLIDDSGQSLTRTLTRSEIDLVLTHRYDLGHLRMEQKIGYENLNYDERDTLAVTQSGTTNVHLTSYDYHAVTAGFLVNFDFSSRLEARVTLDTEKRDYDERKTYTVQYGATIGRPFAIRNFRENAVGVRVAYLFYRENEIRLDADYTRRTDNFENYYGYDHRQYKATLSLRWGPSQDTEISFRFKNKDYPNYHTRNIGTARRVHIDYADLQFEHHVLLVRNITLNAYLRNYNKVSNDPSFDYHDLVAGTGLIFSY